MFSTSLKQTCNEYLIKFSENQSAPKLENRKTSPCSPHAPNLLHLLPSRMVGWHKLCSPVFSYVLLFAIFSHFLPLISYMFLLFPPTSYFLLLCFFIFFPNSPTSILPFFPILPIFPYFPLNIFSYTLFPSRKLEVGDLINKLI